MLSTLLDDLRAERDDLVGHVATADLALAVPAEPWDVRDTVSHLMVGDEKALLATVDPNGFAAELPTVLADPLGFMDSWLQAARGLGNVALAHRLPVGFGVLTTDTLEQALARAGGAAGNKGYEAVDAALTTADVLDQLTRAAPRD